MGMMDRYLIRKIVHYSTGVFAAVMILTGMGMTQPGAAYSLTGGAIDRGIMFQIHSTIWILFVLLLICHVLLSMPLHSTSN
jgi:hypothetical protein